MVGMVAVATAWLVGMVAVAWLLWPGRGGNGGHGMVEVVPPVAVAWLLGHGCGGHGGCGMVVEAWCLWWPGYGCCSMAVVGLVATAWCGGYGMVGMVRHGTAWLPWQEHDSHGYSSHGHSMVAVAGVW